MLEKYLSKIEYNSYEDLKENYKVTVPNNFNFGFDCVDEWAKNPEKMALVWCNDNDEEKKLTFLDIKKESNKIANYLVSIGIEKGDVVLLILKQRYEYWLIATALHKIGAVLIPGSVQLSTKDIVYRTNAAGIKMIIAVKDDYVVEQVENAEAKTPSLKYKATVNGTCGGWIDFMSEAASFSDEFERPTGEKGTSADDLMLIYFTSGTTGMPKMVAHNFKHPLGHITTAKYWHKVEDGKLHLTVSDSGWAKFGWGKIYGQWLSGAVIMAYDMDKFIPDKLLKVVEKYKVTTFCAPPTMYRFFIKEDLSKYDFSSIKHATTAGEPLNPEVYNQFYKATGLKLCEGFGQTESSVLLANFEWFEPKPGSMGKPSPLYDIDIVDDDGVSCPDGEEGEVIIHVDKVYPLGLTIGYYENGKVNSDSVKDGIYHTGDIAWRDFNGHYWFVGRKDDVIKCSGYRIGPFEVESAVLEHPAVLECAVTAAPDEIRGQVVKATVVLTKGYSPSETLIKEIQEHVKKTTAPYKYPRIIEFVDELPKTLGGKIKRAEIRAENLNKDEKR